ncbi:hypothetical protein ACX80S_17960 [Arthrobacter sp. RHLT1-20]
MRFFHENWVPTATHAIGDKAVSFVANTVGAFPANGTIHRIEHIQSIPDSVLEEIVDAGATTSLQPTHCALYSRADHSDNWSRRLGTERAPLTTDPEEFALAPVVLTMVDGRRGRGPPRRPSGHRCGERVNRSLRASNSTRRGAPPGRERRRLKGIDGARGQHAVPLPWNRDRLVGHSPADPGPR